MSIIRTPTGSRRRPTPVAIALAVELLIWAGIVAFTVIMWRAVL